MNDKQKLILLFGLFHAILFIIFYFTTSQYVQGTANFPTTTYYYPFREWYQGLTFAFAIVSLVGIFIFKD